MRNLFVFAACIAAPSLTYAQSVWITYLAARGTLPQSQCWTFSGSSSPAPSLVDNAVEIGPSSYGGTQTFARAVNTDFVRGTVVEAEIYIINSAYRTNPCGAGQRAGTVFSVADNQGRVVVVGIGNSQVYMTCSDPSFVGVNSPTAAVACQGQWRLFRLEVLGTQARLYVDGVLTLTCPTGSIRGTPRRVTFGDGSICAEGHARFRSLRALAVVECSADFNRDGFVDGFDYDEFVTCFEGGSCPCDQSADFNTDGFADGFDYDDFVSAFEAGCL